MAKTAHVIEQALTHSEIYLNSPRVKHQVFNVVYMSMWCF